MTADDFNMLSENLDDVDFLQPVLVVPLEGSNKFRIVDGEHRYEAQRLRDVKTIPCVIADPARFDEDTQRFQTIRMNKIRGKMNQRKFGELVSGLMKKGTYTYEELAHHFGFVDEDEFQHLIDHSRDSLPTQEMKEEFDKAREDIKTVDDLSLTLNRLFTHFGATLPYHFMILDFGGKEHIWVRMTRASFKQIRGQARLAQAEGVTFDSVLRHVLTLMDVRSFVGKYRDNLEKPDKADQVAKIDDLLGEENDA